MKQKKNKPLLIIRSTVPIKGDLMMALHKGFVEQAETGVVILPHFMEATYVPEGVEVVIETKE